MAINSQHPLYLAMHEDWEMMRDLYIGERAVKGNGEKYLPATAGMHLDGMKEQQPGWHAYQAYLKRALFPDYVKDGVEALIGMMHQKPASFELPDVMQPYIEKITLGGEGLQTLLRRINVEQLTTGRMGLLADLPATPNTPVPTETTTGLVPVLPYIATYAGETIINWDEATSQEGFNALNLVVLDESSFARQADGFTWKNLTKYRVLQLGVMTPAADAGGTTTGATGGSENENQAGKAQYLMGTFDNLVGNVEYDASRMQTPMFKGATLESIPFVFINTKDIVSTPDQPPLLGLGRLVLCIYRSEADYRQALFLSGQDTLVVIGGTRNPDGEAGEAAAIRVGAGSRIDLDIGGDAKYIGVNSKGLTEQKAALDTDRANAEQKAGRLIAAGTQTDASGEALKTRITAQTATLNQIACAGAQGLENMLKNIGVWMGLAQPVIDTIKVTPNLEFADFALVAQDIVFLMTARSMGAPISRESIHGIMVDRGMTQLSFEDEMEKIEDENAQLPPSAGTAGGPPLKVLPTDTGGTGNNEPVEKNADGTPKKGTPAKPAGGAAPAK